MKAPGKAKSSRGRGKIEQPHEGGSSDPSVRTPLRPSGIRVMGDMPWGSHICLFYETKTDLLDANALYIKAGLDGNEYCVWAISEPITEDEAWAVLSRDIPDLDNRAASGQFEILPGYDWYLKGDEFDSKKITSGWHEKLQFALDKGFEGLRISGNAFWIERNRWNEFREYEHELDESLEDRPMLVNMLLWGLTTVVVVTCIVEGCSNKDIAKQFTISEETVKRHLSNIFDKTGVSTRLELALFAISHKLVDIDA